MTREPTRTDAPPPSPMGVSGKITAYFQRNALTPLMALVALLLGAFAVHAAHCALGLADELTALIGVKLPIGPVLGP